MNEQDKINYIEFPARDLGATKTFFGAAFDWTFEDYGPDYASFSDRGVHGGFFSSELASSSADGAALVILYSADLEATQAGVEAAGGDITRPIFSFPGGRRFHFREPSGNELAVWSDQGG